MDSAHQTSAHETPGLAAAVPIHVAKASTGPYLRFAKSAIDRILACLFLVIFSPVLLVSSLLVRAKIGTPIIYRQRRVGQHGEQFELLKFRTMITDRRENDAEYPGPDRRRSHKTPDDPRVVGPGTALRSLRLDELPQMWNVVRGDMSLVGPRPEMPEIVAEYESWQHARHTVKPGVTGLWQISDHNGTPMHECTEIDLEYIDKMSIGLDMLILLKTPIAMIRRSGF